MRHRFCLLAIYLLIILVSFSTPALAADRFWDANAADPPNGVYNVANNWNPNAVPGPADTAIFRLGNRSLYTVTFPAAPAVTVSDQLRVGSRVTFARSSGAAYTLDNPTTTEAGRAIIIGELTGDQSSLTSALTLTAAAATIGDAASSEGTLLVNASTFTLNGNTGEHELIVANRGSGALTVLSGGQVHVGALNGTIAVGNHPGSNGTATISGAGSAVNVGGASYIGSRGTGALNISDSGQMTAAAAIIGDVAASDGTLSVNASTLTLHGNTSEHELTVGNHGTGILNVLAGGQIDIGTLNGSIAVGNHPGSNGTGTISGAGSAVNVSLGATIGNLGTGTLNISSGGRMTANTVGSFGAIIAVGRDSIGTMTVDGIGSIWTSNRGIIVGSEGQGTLNISNGGLVNADTRVVIGNRLLGNGTLNLSGTGSRLITGELDLSDGSMTISSAGQLNSSVGFIGGLENTAGTGTVIGSNSKWILSGALQIGRMGPGMLNVLDGGHVSTTAMSLGTPAAGSLNLGVGGSVAVTQFIEVAPSALSNGAIVVNGSGSLLSALDIYVGGRTAAAGGTGRLTINNGVVQVNNLKVWPSGAVDLNGGTLDIAGTLTTVVDSDLNLFGGTLRVRSSGLQTAVNSFHWTGGTLNLVASDLTVGSGGLFGESLLLNSRMSLQVDGALNVSSAASLVGGGAVSGATGLNNGTISIVGGSLSYSQPAVNNGNLDAIRATLAFPGDGIKNNIGLTNNGTLTLANAIVNGDVHSPTGSTINVAAGVVFNGLVSGAANFPGAGTVTFNGGYSPGDSPAAVTFGGDVAIGPSGALEMELGGTTPGSEYDQLNVAGLLSLDGTLAVSLLNQFQPSLGDAFDLFEYLALDGRFDEIRLPPLAAGQFWDTAEFYSTGTISVSAIPEPAAVCIWLTSSVVVGACVLGRRRLRSVQRCDTPV